MTRNEKITGLLETVLKNSEIQDTVALMEFNRRVYHGEPTQENLDALYLTTQEYYKKVNERCKALGLTPLYKL